MKNEDRDHRRGGAYYLSSSEKGGLIREGGLSRGFTVTDFTSPILETGGALYVFIRATRRSGRLKSKGNTFTQLF